MDPSAWATVASVAVTGFVIAVFIGVLTRRQIDQERARDKLIADLRATRAELAVAQRRAGAQRERARGETVLAPAVAARLYKRVQSRDDDALTAREVQVLREVAVGMTNRRIGQQLSIAESTVKCHLLKIYGKLGASDRTSAVMEALKRGVLEPIDPPIGG